MFKNNRLAYIALPFLCAIILATGLIIGNKLGSNPNNSRLDNVMQYILAEYVDSISMEDLENRAIKALLSELDPHSTFITPEEYNDLNDPLSGSFHGIGVQFRIYEDTIMVVEVISGGPSEKQGLKAGDRIVMVDGENVAGVGIENSDVLKKLKGEKGTIVKVSVYRRNHSKLIDFDISRDVIPTKSIDVSYMIDQNIAYIKVSKFSATTGNEFHSALEDLKEKGMSSLILDLRGNGGGYLGEAVRMADEFLQNDEIIVYTEGTHSDKKYYNATSEGIAHDIKLAVLIDEFSASASEIVTGAIQDNDRGIVVGRRSFGKGLVQEQRDFNDGYAIRLTISRYYTPSGRCIQRSYEEGSEQYYIDFYQSLINEDEFYKEMENQPKHYTKNGRTVYGGGGIMPDSLVFKDYPNLEDRYSDLMYINTINNFSTKFTDKYRSTITNFTTLKELEQYLDQNNLIFDSYIDYLYNEMFILDKNYNNKEANKYINNEIKAFVCRNVMGDIGFYTIYNRYDQSIQKAIKAINND